MALAGCLKYRTTKTDDIVVKEDLEDSDQYFQIKMRVPENKRNNRNIGMMAQVWAYLNYKYGKPEFLATSRVEYLHLFHYRKTDVMDADKFKEV